MKKFVAKYGVYLAAVIIFISFAVIYCLPETGGKVISGGDNSQYVGASGEGYRYAAQTGGKGSWWTGSMFCGMPTYQIGGGAKYKAEKWLKPINCLLRKGINDPIWTMFFYFACFFILLLAFGIPPWISLLGALTIGLSTYFITLIPAGHNTKTASIALTAVVLAGFKLIFNEKYVLGSILVMVFVAAGYSLHPQMFYYYCMMIGLFWVAELWQHIKDKKQKELVIGTVFFVVSLGIGAGTGFSKVLVNKEYVKESTRGGSVLDNYLSATGESESSSSDTKTVKGLDLKYATEWSYGIDETFSLLIPGIKGGSSWHYLSDDTQLCKALKQHHTISSQKTFPLYWGPQPLTYGNTYVGAIVCFLFLLGLFIVKGPYKWMLLACTLFSIILSWGGNFIWLTKLFYKYFPLYSKFRAVSSILIVAEITMPLLGFLAIKEMMEGKISRKELTRSVLISGGITVGICLFFLLAGSSIYDFTSVNDKLPADRDWLKPVFIEQRLSLLRGDCFRSIIFILCAIALIWIQRRFKVKALPCFMLVGVLSVIDLCGIDLRYFNHESFITPKRAGTEFKMTDYEKEILQDKDPNFRVYNLTTQAFSESRTSFRLKSVGGYSAAKLSRYDDLIKVHLSKHHGAIFGMLNTKYVIVPGDTFQENKEDVHVLRSKGALGNAWFVDDIFWVDNPKDEIEFINQYDLRHMAIVHEEFKPVIDGCSFAKTPDSRIVLEQYRPDHLEYSSYSSSPGLAVFSEIYYPHGWVARIDGQERQHFRADYLLRALVIPAGRHTITFDFDPQSVKIGDSIALFFIILMYICIAAGVFYGVRNLKTVLK